MNDKLHKFCIKIISNSIALGSKSSDCNKAKAQMFMDELTNSNNTGLEFKYNGNTYNVWNVLLCAIYDNV